MNGEYPLIDKKRRRNSINKKLDINTEDIITISMSISP